MPFYFNFDFLLIKMETGREVTIYDIAKALNVSPSTVSRALKDNPNIRKETRKKIMTVAGEMGYQRNKFASSLRLKRTNTIGVVVPRLNSYFMAAAISGIEKVTKSNGFGLIISQSMESETQEASCISTLFNSMVDGMLVSLAYDTKTLKHFNILFRKDIPVVFFDRVAQNIDCMSVVIDNYRAGYEATSHLIGQGSKRIAFLGGNLLRNVYSERLRGYRQALDENGIDFNKQLVFISDLSEEAGTRIADRILKMKPRPDGIFAANDTSAVAAMIRIQEAGLGIPDDIAVVGFNNEPISHVIRPNLTTIDYPARDIGEVAANSLINKLKEPGSDSLTAIVLKHSLIVRQSSVRKGQF